MRPTKNALMRVEKGRDKNTITPGTIRCECALACPHPFLTARPLAPEANSVFWSTPWVHCRCLLDWHKPETQRLNLITETIMIVTQFDPDLYSNGLIYLVCWRCIFWGLSVNPETSPSLSLCVSLLKCSHTCWQRDTHCAQFTVMRMFTYQLVSGFPFFPFINFSIN